MSLAEDLLIILTSYSGGYRLMRHKLSGLESPSPYRKIDYRKIKEQTLRTTLSRLKKRGLVNNRSGVWLITRKGKEYLEDKLKLRIPHFRYLKSDYNKKEMVVVFDIPEKKKHYRNWLRSELRALGFVPIQKSVWLGPAPLPKEFIEYLSEMNILKYLKFFKATPSDVVG